ncbi:MAG: cation diffusion facilitator family transporter [bacterium JZ-2024 1]
MQREKAIQRVLWIVLGANLLVAISKIVVGWLIHSSSLTSDGWHSFSDATNNIVGLVGIYFASRPKDEKHPYGHGKIETLTAMLIGGMLFAIAFELLKGIIHHWRKGIVPLSPDYSFFLVGLTLMVNTGVCLYERSKGILYKSEILIADSLHTATDIGVSFSVIVSLLAVRYGWFRLDQIIAVGIVGFIMRGAFLIFLRSSQTLIDTQVLSVEKIQRLAERVPGVRRCYEIRSRGKENEVYVDLHISVDSKTPTEEAHRIAHEVENALRSSIPEIAEIIIHVEPEIVSQKQQ